MQTPPYAQESDDSFGESNQVSGGREHETTTGDTEKEVLAGWLAGRPGLRRKT